MSERLILAEELFIQENWRKPSSKKELYDFLFSKKQIISQLISNNWDKYISWTYINSRWENVNQINWYDLISDYREQIWLPKFVPLDKFNALTQLVMIGWDSIDYDSFLKLMKQKDLSKARWIQPPKIDKLIKNQWSRLAQWIVELVSNAIDASSQGKWIWRFWEWFYQAVKFLDDEESVLSVKTKKDWAKAYGIDLVNRSWDINIWSQSISKYINWTQVVLQKNFDKETVEYLISHIKETFGTNSSVNVFVNGEKINELGWYVYINWKKLETENLPSVYIVISEKGFEIVDRWVWMDSKTISEKLLYPTSSTKKKENPTWEKLDTMCKDNTKFFYRTWKVSWEKTTIRLQVAWVMIEEFHEGTIGDIRDLTFELPYFTWLPESRNEIIPTREVVVSIKHAIEKIYYKSDDLAEKIKLIEIFGKIINKLKQRKTDETDKQFLLDVVAKNSFQILKTEIESNWKIIISWTDGILDVVKPADNIVFISSDFVDFEPNNIPWIKKLENIDKTWATKVMNFYEVDFRDEAQYDFVVIWRNIIVNSKYTDDDEKRLVLNTLINLNVWYEAVWAKVYYGRIVKSSENWDYKIENNLGKDKTRKVDSWVDSTLLETELEEVLPENVEKMIDEICEKYWEYIEFLYKVESSYTATTVNIKDFIISSFKRNLLSSSLDLKTISYDDCLTLILFKFDDIISEPFKILELKEKYLNIIKNKSDKIVYSIFDIQNILFDLFENNKLSFDEYISFMDKVIDLYDQEPEYIMQIVERFKKDNRLFWNILKSLKEKENRKKLEEKVKINVKEVSSKHTRNLLDKIISDALKNRTNVISIEDLLTKLWLPLKFAWYLESKFQYLFQINWDFDHWNNYINLSRLSSYSYYVNKLVDKIWESLFHMFKNRVINFYESEILGNDKNNIMFDPFRTMWLDIWKDYFPNNDDDLDDGGILILAYVILEHYCNHCYKLDIEDKETAEKGLDWTDLLNRMNSFYDYAINCWEPGAFRSEEFSKILWLSDAWLFFLQQNLEYLFEYKDYMGIPDVENYINFIYILNNSLSSDKLKKLKSEVIKIYESDIINEKRSIFDTMTKFGLEKAIEDNWPDFEESWLCIKQIVDLILMEHYFLKAINNDFDVVENDSPKYTVDLVRNRIDSFINHRVWGHIKLKDENHITLEELLDNLSLWSKNAYFLMENIGCMLDDNWCISFNFIYLYNQTIWMLMEDLWDPDKYEEFKKTIVSAVNKYWYFGDYEMFDNIIANFFPNKKMDQQQEVTCVSFVLFEYYLLKLLNNDLINDDLEKNEEVTEEVTRELLMETSLTNPKYKKLLEFISSDYFYESNHFSTDEDYFLSLFKDRKFFNEDKLKAFLEEFWIDISIDRWQVFSKFTDLKDFLSKFYDKSLNPGVQYKQRSIIFSSEDEWVLYDIIYEMDLDPLWCMLYRKALIMEQEIINQIDDDKLREIEKFIDTKTTLDEAKSRFISSFWFSAIDPQAIYTIDQWLFNILDTFTGPNNIFKDIKVRDFNEIPKSSSKYPSDLVMFVEFLMKWWEFLKSQEPKVETLSANKLRLSELMCLNRLENKWISTIWDISDINDLLSKLRWKDYKFDIYQREIFSGIEWQDRSSMIWIRELIQNSIDAINKNDSAKKVDIDFYVAWENWTSSIFDNVWMNLFEVFNYLLVIWNSWKVAWEWVWMFGQGFFSAAIWAKEIRLKTSKWDGKCIYVSLKPIYNDESSIIDFDIDFDVKDEEFKWTLIERVDQSAGIMWNFKALIWVNNMQKYIGNIREFDIDYKWERINRSDKNKVVETMEVWDLWNIELIETDDKIERLTKDDLYCSEIPEDFISDLPDWIVDFIRSKNISINLPSKIPLTKSRNSMTDYEYHLWLLKPIIYRMIVSYVLKNYVEWDLKIPMLPNDFFGNAWYRPVYNRESWEIADKYNLWEDLSKWDVEYLKDKVNMMSFLLYVKFENKGRQIDLIWIRNDLLAKRKLNISSSQSFDNAIASNSITRDSHEKSNKWKLKYNLSIKEVSEELNISQKHIKDFLKFIKEKFKPLIDKHFDWKFKFNFHYEEWDFIAMANRGLWFWLSFNINSSIFVSYIMWYRTDEISFEALVRTITHEMTHNLEDVNTKWWSHEEDTEHSGSFRKIQTDVLTTLLRS